MARYPRNYFPDNWVVIKINGDDPHYRVLGGWSGGYTTGDEWRLNSGITKVEDHDGAYHFFGSSGSCYICGKESYGLRNNNYHVWHTLKERDGDKVELMKDDTDWLSVDWIIKE